MSRYVIRLKQLQTCTIEVDAAVIEALGLDPKRETRNGLLCCNHKYILNHSDASTRQAIYKIASIKGWNTDDGIQFEEVFVEEN